MSGSGSEPDALGRLADEFLERYRRGERPAPTEYAARHPELADQIREMFPALAMLEDVRPGPRTLVGAAGEPCGTEPSPRRLGEYRLVREIGRGGMGVVYEAEQESLGRRVALKVLPPGALGDARQVERFGREARAAARLHHTNIVPVFAVGEEGGTHYYVMQYIEGRPLDEVLAELRLLRIGAGPAAGPPTERGTAPAESPPEGRAAAGGPSAGAVARSLSQGHLNLGSRHEGAGPVNPGDADRSMKAGGSPAAPAATPGPLSDPRRPYAKSVAHIGIQIAGALEYAAGQGVLHRDVKPSNVLLDVWGTVWLTDFGLAKTTGTKNLTRTGDLLGTLRYLAPERFGGRADARSDVYSLGLTLYELLALRPAFGAAVEAELIAQITSEEPPRLDRLDPQLPRDLVTVVHKAMARDPADRYQSAGALAEDLRRFLDDRSILARSVSLPEQAWRWCRRNPTGAALVAALLALFLLASGAGVWFVRHQADRRAEAARQEQVLRNEVGTALVQAVSFRQGFHFREGRALLEQARQRLEPDGPDDLRQRLNQALADLNLAENLDAARLLAASYVEGKFDFAGAERRYAAAFAEAGVGQAGDDVEAVAARVKASAVRGALVAALDDWAVCTADQGRSAWMLRVARLADPDPEGWRDRVRDPVAWNNAAALAELARTAPVAEPSVPLLLALGQRLQATGGDAAGFLRRVQREHPADFWANLSLGNALKYGGSGEAIGYYRVALAIRPESAIGYYNLGEVLRFQNWLDEAIDYYQQALRIDPKHVWAHLNRGSVLAERGRPDEALDHFQQAARIDPRNVAARIRLGYALKEKGRLDEALDHFQQAITLDSRDVAPLNGLRGVLMRQGRREEVQAAWRKILDANPPEHDAWFGYAELCLFLGQQEEYRRACRALLGRFGATPDPFVAERTGRACLLLPASEDELRKAIALIDRTRAPLPPEHNWAPPFFLFAQGLAEYRAGRLDSAISLMDGAIPLMAGDLYRVLRPAPRLVLAMARHGQGRKGEARKALAAAVLSYDWSPALADSRDAWICHVLRREAEALILPDMPAFLGGKYQPRDDDERVALLGACQFKKLHRTAVQLYADAFAADPKLADDLPAGHRYRAACYAALAAAGRGEDARALDDQERARLRQQALDWLRADLAACARATDRALVQRALKRWQQDADLAGLREPAALAELPPGERQGWAQLWSEAADRLQKTGGQP
jgi:serine/threonine-protein kinase